MFLKKGREKVDFVYVVYTKSTYYDTWVHAKFFSKVNN